MSKIKLILISGVLSAGPIAVMAEDAQNRQPVASIVGEEFHLAIGQGTNVVAARLVEWNDSHGLKCRTYVFLSSPNRQLITAPSTNQVCLLKGRLVSVSIGVQSFYVQTSLPAEQAELTPLLAQSAAARQSRRTSAAKEIDIRNLLRSELDKHLAQPLILRDVSARAEQETVVVDFISYTGRRGRVTLDSNLEVLSMSLTGNGGGGSGGP